MEFNKRKSPRLDGYDYSTPGVYFVTICTYKMRMLFWEKPMRPAFENHSENLNFAGKIADEIIRTLPEKFPVVIDKYVIMPNHVHILLSIKPYDNIIKTQTGLLPQIIGYLKAKISHRLREFNVDDIIWHRSFYDHVVRNEEDYQRVCQYIESNPNRWEKDRFFKKQEETDNS